MKKKLLVLLFSMVSVLLFSNSNTEVDSSSKDVTGLKMYLVGDTVPDYPLMLDELNKKMSADLNASLDVNFTTWVDWQTKLRLILASGEEVDLMHMAPWGIYTEQAQAGNLLDLRELAPIHAPETWASYSDEVLKQAEVNGGIYMLPFNYEEPVGQGIVYRKDLAKKYGISEVNSSESLYQFLSAVKENEDMIPYNAGEFDLEVWVGYLDMFEDVNHKAKKYLLQPSEGVMAYVYYDDPETIHYDYEGAQFKKASEFFNRLFEEDLVSRNVLSNTIGSREAFIAGKSAMTFLNPLNANEQYQKLKSANPDWELGLWMGTISGYEFEKKTAINNGMSIPVSSKNPEKALQLLEKLHQDQDYHDFTTYGLRGVHWDLNDAGEIITPLGLKLEDSGFQWDSPCPWGWREEKFYRLNPLKSQSVWSEIRETQIELQKDLVDAKWTNFSFDKSEVSTEISAASTVRSGRYRALSWGVLYSDEEYEKLFEEYKNAGIDTIKAELEKQWLAYLNNNK